MPSASPRGGQRRATRPRHPGRRFETAAPPGRPLLVPFAAVFGVLVAAEAAYFVWLLDFGWYLVVPLLLAVAAGTGAVLVWQGRRGGWQLLAGAAVLPLLGLLGLAVLFGILGGGSALWSALLLLVGPVGCLVLTLQRPVRSWRGPDAGTRPGGGRRGRAPSG